MRARAARQVATLTLLLSFFFAAGCAPPVYQAGALRDNIYRHTGQTIRIHGVLNRCDYDDCALCPDWDHVGNDGCLDLQSWADDPGGDEMASVYRYSEIIVTAFIAERNTIPLGILDCAGPYRLCLGPLSDVRVEKLIEKRPSFKVKDGNAVPLMRASETDDKALRDLFNRSGRYTGPAKTFVVPLDGIERPESDGYLCFHDGRYDDDPEAASWPAKDSDLLPNSSNHFWCFQAHKTGNEAWQATTSYLPSGNLGRNYRLIRKPE